MELMRARSAMEKGARRKEAATTSRLGYKSRGFWRRRGVFWVLGGRSAVGFYGHSLSSFVGSWLEWLHLFRGKPECSRQVSISQPPCNWILYRFGFLVSCVRRISVSAFSLLPVSLSLPLFYIPWSRTPAVPPLSTRARVTTRQREDVAHRNCVKSSLFRTFKRSTRRQIL
jgi:hypothetical protein